MIAKMNLSSLARRGVVFNNLFIQFFFLFRYDILQMPTTKYQLNIHVQPFFRLLEFGVLKRTRERLYESSKVYVEHARHVAWI